MLRQLTSLRRGKLKIPEHAYNNPMLTRDPIQWWEDYGHTCRQLAKLARRIFCIPPTAAGKLPNLH